MRSDDSGSPESGEPEFLLVGRVGRPHGVRGEVQFQVLTDFPERIVPGKRLLLGDDKKPYEVLTVRGSEERLILGLAGLADRDAAGLLRNELVFVPASEVPALPEGEYYLHELIDLPVQTEDGTLLGILTEILYTGANDVFVVEKEGGGELLLPAIDDVVLEVDIEKGRIVVRLLEGL